MSIDKIIEEKALKYAADLDTIPNLNIRMAYEAGARAMAFKWHSVFTEGNPDEPGPYWVYRKSSNGKYSQHPMSVRMWDGEKWASSQDVTHWAYVPDHPTSL